MNETQKQTNSVSTERELEVLQAFLVDNDLISSVLSYIESYPTLGQSQTAELLEKYERM